MDADPDLDYRQNCIIFSLAHVLLCENHLSSVSAILPTNKQTNWKHNLLGSSKNAWRWL